MPRAKLPADQHKILVNFYLDPKLLLKLKVICFRRSVTADAWKISEGSFLSDAIQKTVLPKKPAKEKYDAYYAKYPKRKAENPET